MARIRSIKPEFWGHAKTARISRDARLLFLGLLNESDDVGRLLGAPRRIAGNVFPNDDDVSPELVETWLLELERVKLIDRYTVSGIAYVLIHGFAEHQKVSHPAKSHLPGPEMADEDVFPTSSGESPEILAPDLGSRIVGSRIVGSLAPTKRARQQDPIWEALMAACAIDPAGITKSARGAYNRACSELKTVNASVEEIHERADAYRLRWPDTSCTPSALVRHWAECEPDRQVQAPSAARQNVQRLRALDGTAG